MILHRNPFVFTVEIKNGFHLVVNPLIREGNRVINTVQLNLLNQIDGQKCLEEIAVAADLSFHNTIKIVEVFRENGIISTENKFVPLQTGNTPKSLDIWVHTTNSCTLACTYCYIHKDKSHMSAEIMKKFAAKLIQVAVEKRLRSIHLRLAGGEPMTRFKIWKPYLLKLKSDLKKINCSLTIGFLTNLTILNQEIIDFIKSEKCNISVSLDGIGRYQDQTRMFPSGRGSFDIIEGNLNKLLAQNIRPFILVVVSEKNLEGLPELTEYILGLNLSFRYSFVKGEGLDLKRLSETLNLCYQKMEEYVDKGYEFSKKHRLCDVRFLNPATQVCESGKNSFAMNIDGKMHLCQLAMSEEKPIGSLHADKNLLDINMAQTQYPNLAKSQDCEKCQFGLICAGGCPLDRVNDKSRFCEIFKEFIPKVYRIIGKEKLIGILKEYKKA